MFDLSSFYVFQRFREFGEYEADEQQYFETIEEAAESVSEIVGCAFVGQCLQLKGIILGNGYLLDREFLNGQSVSMSHFGNNFAIKVTQLIYAGGADKGFMVIV